VISQHRRASRRSARVACSRSGSGCELTAFLWLPPPVRWGGMTRSEYAATHLRPGPAAPSPLRLRLVQGRKTMSIYDAILAALREGSSTKRSALAEARRMLLDAGVYMTGHDMDIHWSMLAHEGRIERHGRAWGVAAGQP